MNDNVPSQKWTDRDRIELAIVILNGAPFIKQGTAQAHEEFLETIQGAKAALTLPAEELEAVQSKLTKYADRLRAYPST